MGLAFPGEGVVVATTIPGVGGRGGAAGGVRFLVASSWACGVREPVSHPSLMKEALAVGAQGVFLCAALRGVAKAVAIDALSVAGCLDYLVDFERF